MRQEKVIIAKNIYDADRNNKLYLDTKRTGNISCMPSHGLQWIKGIRRNLTTIDNADWLGANNVVRRLFGYMSKNLGDSDYRPEHGSVESEGVTGSAFGISKGFVAQLGMS